MSLIRKIDSYQVGQKAHLKKRITRREVEQFVELTGDDNPIHVDEVYAQKTSMKGAVVHGMLGASFLSTLIGKHLPGEGALWLSNSLEFHLPVRVNDELDIASEVTQIHASQSILVLAIRITNQDGRLVTSGEAKVKVLDPPVAPEPVTGRASQKWAMITGASSGIGAATAIELARRGYDLLLAFNRNRDGIDLTAKAVAALGMSATILQADLTSEEGVRGLIESMSNPARAISALVLAASPNIVDRKFEDLQWSDVERQWNAQVKSAFLCIKGLMPSFVPNEASIVLIGSIVADLDPPPAWFAYNLAKHGVHSLTHCLAGPLGARGVRINTVAPGMTDTKFVASIPERVRLQTEMQTPLRRLATPEDVAQTIAFLVSDGARHITGETLRVNGGRTLQ